MANLKLGILVSGRGSNLQAIIDAIRDGSLDAEIKLVVSNKSKAQAVERAREANVPVQCFRIGDFAGRGEFDGAVVDALRKAGVELVVLAGFMRLITPVLLNAFEDRIINIHPSLLPAFPGIKAQHQAIEYGVKVAGCTVHFVDETPDGGPVIGQAAVEVRDDDTGDSLAERILVEEHRLLVDVLRALSEERIALDAAPGPADGPESAPDEGEPARRRVRVGPS